MKNFYQKKCFLFLTQVILLVRNYAHLNVKYRTKTYCIFYYQIS